MILPRLLIPIPQAIFFKVLALNLPIASSVPVVAYLIVSSCLGLVVDCNGEEKSQVGGALVGGSLWTYPQNAIRPIVLSWWDIPSPCSQLF